MSRHTRQDGTAPDPRLKYDLHMPHLAPDLQMAGSWYKKDITWEMFAAGYLEKLRTNAKADFYIKRLVELAAKHLVILSSIELHHVQCHRGLLAAYICGEWSAKHPEYGSIDVRHLEDSKKKGN